MELRIIEIVTLMMRQLEKHLHEQYAINNNSKTSSLIAILAAVMIAFTALVCCLIVVVITTICAKGRYVNCPLFHCCWAVSLMYMLYYRLKKYQEYLGIVI